jgi:hypothetical protein
MACETELDLLGLSGTKVLQRQIPWVKIEIPKFSKVFGLKEEL